jgi:hypothetical protein
MGKMVFVGRMVYCGTDGIRWAVRWADGTVYIVGTIVYSIE